MTVPVELFEYKSCEVELSPAAQRVLAVLGANKLSVTVGSRPGTCWITATQWTSQTPRFDRKRSAGSCSIV